MLSTGTELNIRILSHISGNAVIMVTLLADGFPVRIGRIKVAARRRIVPAIQLSRICQPGGPYVSDNALICITLQVSSLSVHVIRVEVVIFFGIVPSMKRSRSGHSLAEQPECDSLFLISFTADISCIRLGICRKQIIVS